MTTQIIKCENPSCTSEFQDKMYGKGNRVGNVMRSGQLRCTVCSTISGSKAMISMGKPAKVADAEPAPVSAKEKDNKGKQTKKPAKDKKTPKPRIDRSKKTGKK